VLFAHLIHEFANDIKCLCLEKVIAYCRFNSLMFYQSLELFLNIKLILQELYKKSGFSSVLFSNVVNFNSVLVSAGIELIFFPVAAVFLDL